MFPFPMPIPVKVFVWIMGGAGVLCVARRGGGGVANATHLGGLLVGYVYLKGPAGEPPPASDGRGQVPLCEVAHGSPPQEIRAYHTGGRAKRLGPAGALRSTHAPEKAICFRALMRGGHRRVRREHVRPGTFTEVHLAAQGDRRCTGEPTRGLNRDGGRGRPTRSSPAHAASPKRVACQFGS